MTKRIPVNLSGLEVAKGDVKINKDKCKGCRFCIEFCPNDVLQMSDGFNKKGYHYPEVAQDKEDACTVCNICELTCPDFAIYVDEKSKLIKNKDVITG
ncbi:ferredoxin family protein [Elusimicrobiota bacterium]